jgi:hypothetical protein
MRRSARAKRAATRRGTSADRRTTLEAPPWSAVTGPDPIIESMLEPPVRDEAPTDDAITDYDQMLFVTYLRLLDAEADGSATWEEVCRIVLRIDPAREPARARRAYDTHMARARWMTEVGWRHLMRMSRLH